MAKIRIPEQAKLFVGMLSSESELFEECVALFENEFGPVDQESAAVPWTNTSYYEPEMGNGLLRKFVFFEQLIDPGMLAGIKLLTNGIEEHKARKTSGGLNRRINLDPGYITEAKVVLASAKDFAHRVYIGGNIYAEVTLRYDNARRSFLPLEYTFPEYRSDGLRSLFTTARDSLRKVLGKKHRA